MAITYVIHEALHRLDLGFLVCREGDDGNLPEVDFLQRDQLRLAVVLLDDNIEPDTHAADRSGLHQGTRLACALHVVHQQLALDVESLGVLFHLRERAHRLGAVVLPEGGREAALGLPVPQARGEGARGDYLTVAVDRVINAGVSGELAGLADVLYLEAEVTGLSLERHRRSPSAIHAGHCARPGHRRRDYYPVDSVASCWTARSVRRCLGSPAGSRARAPPSGCTRRSAASGSRSSPVRRCRHAAAPRG